MAWPGPGERERTAGEFNEARSDLGKHRAKDWPPCWRSDRAEKERVKGMSMEEETG